MVYKYKISPWLVGAALLLGLPETVIKYPWGIPVPIQNAGTLIIAFVACFVYLKMPRRHPKTGTIGSKLLGSVLLYTCLVGAVSYAEVDFHWYLYLRELSYFTLCLSGIVLGTQINPNELTKICEKILLSVGLSLIACTLLLSARGIGVVDPLTGRIIDGSLYNYSNLIFILCPIIVANSQRSSGYILFLAALSTTSLLGFAMVSGTRSVLLESLILILLTLYFAWKKIGRTILNGRNIFALLVAVAFTVTVALIYDGTALFNRIVDSDIKSDARSQELNDFFEMKDRWFPVGAGIGVGFHTIIVADTTSAFGDGKGKHIALVSAPHIGIFAWPIKAGLMAIPLLMFMIFQALKSLMLIPGRRGVIINFFTGLPPLIAIGSISGGWNTIELLLTGIILGCGTHYQVTLGSRSNFSRRLHVLTPNQFALSSRSTA